MVEYEIVPSEFRFFRDLPYRLHLVNAGKEGHDFTAPDFFAAVEVHNAGALNESGSSVFLQTGNRHLFHCAQFGLVRTALRRPRLGRDDRHDRHRLGGGQRPGTPFVRLQMDGTRRQLIRQSA